MGLNFIGPWVRIQVAHRNVSVIFSIQTFCIFFSLNWVNHNLWGVHKQYEPKRGMGRQFVLIYGITWFIVRSPLTLVFFMLGSVGLVKLLSFCWSSSFPPTPRALLPAIFLFTSGPTLVSDLADLFPNAFRKGEEGAGWGLPLWSPTWTQSPLTSVFDLGGCCSALLALLSLYMVWLSIMPPIIKKAKKNHNIQK